MVVRSLKELAPDESEYATAVQSQRLRRQKALKALQKILAQPAQEEKFCDSNCVWTDHHPDCNLAQPEYRAVKTYHGGKPVYVAQRPWVGLTEQERNDMEDLCGMIIGKFAFDVIEAKLKELNT
jgi:hypothetical protein